MCEKVLKLIVGLLLLFWKASGASIVQTDEFQVKAIGEQLDPAGSYLLSWEVDLKEQKITFEVEAATLGYVGLGISPSGNMAGADIFIGGVYPNGTSYGYDMHASSMTMPSYDEHSDWTLIEATEKESKTYLKFSRLLNTCDDEDYPISNDTVRVIWSMGETDDIMYHKGNRGTSSLNLLMPADDDFNPDEYLHWDLETEIEMPAQDTTYWCSIKKAPPLNTTHHIIGFEPILTSELAMNYTHHFIIYKCTTPEGENADEFFGPYLDHPGDECYLPYDQQKLPITYCMSQYVYVWSKGGKRMVFPEGVGYPFPEKVGENNYYLFEIHYDNPDERAGITFKTGGRVLYTDKEMGTDAELLTLAHDVGIGITIPPNQKEFVVSGQCSSQCTEEGLSEGINVFNSLLHSHLSGRKLKVRHFREDVELPWLDFDNHYDFNFQQNKPLRDFVKILPGDALTVECTYSTTWNPNKTVIGGLSTREEMCMAFLWYYPKQKLDYCGSYYPDDVHFRELGVTNYSISNPAEAGLSVYTILEPEELAGSYLDSLNNKFKWNETFIREYERRKRYDAHQSGCLAKLRGSSDIINVQFPDDFVKYVPEDVCKRQTVDPPGNSSFKVFMLPFSILSWALVASFLSRCVYV